MNDLDPNKLNEHIDFIGCSLDDLRSTLFSIVEVLDSNMCDEDKVRISNICIHSLLHDVDNIDSFLKKLYSSLSEVPF